MRAIYSPPDLHPRCDNRVIAFTFYAIRVRVFGSPFAARLAEGRGVNEEPQVARKGRPFSPLVVTQSAGRPTDLVGSSLATFTELRVFLPTLHSIYTIRGVGEGPISHGRLELRPYQSHVPERDRWRKNEREKTDLRGFGGSPGFPSASHLKRRYHGVVGDSRSRERASERTVTDATN